LDASITADRRDIDHAIPAQRKEVSILILTVIERGNAIPLVARDLEDCAWFKGATETITYRNSTKVPVLTGISMSAMYLKQKLTNCLYFSCPNQPMKLVLAICFPSLYAVKPFSAKQKSNRPVTGIEGVPSCSCCLTRSEPPTKPMAHLWRRAERS